MKNIVITFVLAIGVAALQFAGCLSSPKSAAVSRAEGEEVAYADGYAVSELDAANDSLRLFRKESEARIRAYDKSIASLKLKMAQEKAENRALYEKRIAEAEQLNHEVKVKLRAYTKEGNVAWGTFKDEFNRDMDALGRSISNVFTAENK
jgi:hypothetical protein